MQSAVMYYGTHLLFTVACMSLAFVFSEMYLKLFLDIVIDALVENFKGYLLMIKNR